MVNIYNNIFWGTRQTERQASACHSECSWYVCSRCLFYGISRQFRNEFIRILTCGKYSPAPKTQTFTAPATSKTELSKFWTTQALWQKIVSASTSFCIGSRHKHVHACFFWRFCVQFLTHTRKSCQASVQSNKNLQFCLVEDIRIFFAFWKHSCLAKVVKFSHEGPVPFFKHFCLANKNYGENMLYS